MKTLFAIITAVSGLLAFPSQACAMHIADGVLPASWSAFWYLMAIPVVAMGLRAYREKGEASPLFRPLTGFVGAAVFVISCMPIPVPYTGTTSHPCGTGLAAILLGPWLTAAIASVTLLLQALFLAHGGLTTLGANIFSMGVAGAFSGYAVFRLAKWLGLPLFISAFMAGIISNWVTYATTSAELALALHGDGPVVPLFIAIVTAFVPTQVPLGIMEGFMTAFALRFFDERRADITFAMEAGGEK